MNVKTRIKKSFMVLFGTLIITLFCVWIVLTNPILKPSPKTVQWSVDVTLLKSHVQFLTLLEPSRNYQRLEALETAVHYLESQCQSYGLETEVHYFFVRNQKYQNLYCRYGDPSLPKMIIGAHYDVAGEQPGADDNASGVAGVLELARLFSQWKPELSYQVEMAFYTLEEPPSFGTTMMGSYFHAKSLMDQEIEVVGMISLEMIGYFSEEEGSQNYPHPTLKWIYPSKGNFIAMVGQVSDWFLTRSLKKKFARYSVLPIVSINAPSSIQGIDFSDHRNFWAFNFPAIMITDTAFYRNPHYHQKTDSMETLDFEKMAQVVHGVFGVLVD